MASATTNVSKSYATGYVSANGNFAGGLVGNLSRGAVNEVYATGTVWNYGTSSENTGGLVGANDYGTITNAYASGKVNGVYNVGGLVGINTGTISVAYATGVVYGTLGVGGLVGKNYYGDNPGRISQAYASGLVRAANNFGGLVGAGNASTVTNSYWDEQAADLAASPGGGVGLSSAQAGTASAYAGFDFNTVWYQTSNMRPILRWEAGDTVNGVTTIKNLHQLVLIGANLSGNYVLGNDIDASETKGSWDSASVFSSIWGTTGSHRLGNPGTGRHSPDRSMARTSRSETFTSIGLAKIMSACSAMSRPRERPFRT